MIGLRNYFVNFSWKEQKVGRKKKSESRKNDYSVITNESLEMLTEKYKKNIVSSASKLMNMYNIPKTEFQDMFQIGVEGIMKALCSYDVTRGSPFDPYAFKTIYNGMEVYARRYYPYKMTGKNKFIHSKLFNLDSFES